MYVLLLSPFALANPLDVDGDGYPASNDCNDFDAAVHPGASEVVGDNVDNDCDGHATCYRDSDDDGYRTNSSIVSIDADCSDPSEGRANDGIDCNDLNATIRPGAPEVVADGIDQNCDGDETCYLDDDNDGARTSANRISTDFDCADAREAVLADPIDCDDGDAGVRPGATEVVGDGVDQNCNGTESCFADTDNDGARTSAVIVSSDRDCNDPNEGRQADPLDCDDARSDVHPGAAEVVGDHLDQDCDGHESCFRDADNDGARTTAVVSSTDADCRDANEGVPGDPLDCNDAVASIHPGAAELIADGVDQNCDGGEICYADLDGDGARLLTTVVSVDPDCADPNEALWTDPVDCLDSDAAVHPGATEVVADGVDQDCDGDEACYADEDDDGARTEDVVVSEDLDCDDPAEAIEDDALDCDDVDPGLHPGAPEVCDGWDNDCDAVVDFIGCDPEDLDNDGLTNIEEADLCAALGLGDAGCAEDPDLDEDGVIDGTEVGSDPGAPLDTDGDADPDLVDVDDDGDGLPTLHEIGIACAAPLGHEFDVEAGYWRFDCRGVEYDFGGNLASDYPDLDGDGAPDFRDGDDDGDGVDSVIESDGDVDCDGVVNYRDPADADGPCAGTRDPETDGAAEDARFEPKEEAGGCACSARPGASGALAWALGLVLLLRRRRG